jgi:broad specificity phosphatase PhoE
MGAPSNTDQSSSSTKKQNVWIVRYGLTKYPLVEYLGPFNSPLDPTDGMDHAQAIAGKIQQEVMESSSCSEPVHVYSSPFTRTSQTANMIASKLPNGAQVRIEEGLTEWQQKALLVELDGTVTYPKTKKELSMELDNIDLYYESANPQASCSPGDNDSFVEESEQELFERCSQTLDGILMNSACHGESFVIVSHAPCDQSMAVYFEGKTLGDSSLSPWPLGGITKFSRVVYEDGSFGPWEMEIYGDTEHMPGMYKPGFKAWSLPILTKHAALESDFDEVPELQVAQ